MNTPKIAILMAGFHGEKYLHEQIFSLKNQKQVEIDIFIRVDGDSLIFQSMLENLAIKNKNIFLLKGDILSSSGTNFYNLILTMIDTTYDYYALCDQDDIWLENKLIRAVECISNSESLAYSSGCTAFYFSGEKKVHQLGLQNKYDFLFQAAGPGCTYVLKNEGFIFLQNFLNENKKLLEVNAHDWLIYFILRLAGKKWYLDQESNLFYRQHSFNVAGINSGFVAKFKRFKLLFSGWYIEDLKALHLFARSKGFTSNLLNPLSLRRSKIYSIVTWIYYHIFFKKKIINIENER